jgi:hypothetical protein
MPQNVFMLIGVVNTIRSNLPTTLLSTVSPMLTITAIRLVHCESCLWFKGLDFPDFRPIEGIQMKYLLLIIKRVQCGCIEAGGGAWQSKANKHVDSIA